VAINAGDFDLVYDAGKAEPTEQLAEKEADGATVKQCPESDSFRKPC